ncbi:MAG: hypothetical protein KC478_17875, partial [Bacteriovoracaceae bacterium]|nr:hypothetical protein [Bacteriovoracaceae bacterium]
MKLLFCLVLMFSAAKLQASDYTIKLVPVQSVMGLVTSEDAINLRVQGYLPNGCYSDPKFRIKRAKIGNDFFVKVFSKVSNLPCIQVIRPYDITINLGVVDEGVYRITV